MKSLYLTIIAFVVMNAVVAQSGPGGVGNSANNILWLKSDGITGLSNGDYVSTWNDNSGNSNNMTQSDNLFKPNYVTNVQNGFPVVRFQQINNRLIKNTFSTFPTSAATVIVLNKTGEAGNDAVLSYASSASFNDFLLFNSSSYNVFRNTNINTSVAGNDNAWHIIDYSWQSSGGNTLLWKDGAQAFSGTLSSGTSITAGGCLAIGAEQDAIDGSYDATQDHQGDFLEFMMFNNVLNNAQRVIIANYLATKYSLNISNDKYAHTTHSYEMAGIGRYSATATHTEAQSASVLTIYGASGLDADGEYLMFAHDNGAISAWSSTNCPSNINKLAREWRLDETGDVGTVDFKVSGSSLPAHTSGYTSYGIMVDADGDYTAGATVYKLDLSGSDYIYDNADIADGDYISIVELKLIIEFTTSTGTGDESVNASASIGINFKSSSSVSVEYTSSNSSATAGSDYTGVSASTATIAAGASSTTINITVNNDATNESDETFLISLANPSAGVSVGSIDEYTYTIEDNDNSRKVAFDAASSSGSESTTSVNIGLSISLVDNTSNTTVDYAITGGTATNGSDYSLSSGTVTFTTGQTTANIPVTITNDTKDEENQTFIISLSNPTNCNLNTPSEHTYTINDEDAAPNVNFSASSASGYESTSSASVQITLSAVSEKIVTVYYSLGGTATQNTDYTFTASPITISAGQSNKTLSLAISNDYYVETNETVIATLSSATNGTLGSTTSYTYTITNDDNYGNAGPGGVGKSTNLSLWVKSDDLSMSDGDRISTWSDQSGNAHHLTQSNSVYAPAYYANVANGFPVVRFNQDYNRLIHNSYNTFPTAEITTIFVNKSNGESEDGMLSYAVTGSNNEYLIYNSANVNLFRGTTSVNTTVNNSTNSFNIISSSWSATTDLANMDKNGTRAFSNSLVAGNISTGGCLAIGAEQDVPDGSYELSQTFTGDFTEVIIFSFVINSAQQNIINNYLSSKYNIAVANDLYAYDKSHPTTPYYYYNVTGIGMESSTSFHDDAKGKNIVRMYTPSSLNNSDYLMWGDDNKAFDAQHFSIPWSATPDNVGNYMKRVWRADKTNEVGTVTVVVDLSGWTFTNSNNIKLLIDGDDGDFANATKVSIASYSAPYATFNAVNFSDGDWFTFGEENGGGGTLPVTFVSLTAEKEQESVLVKWSTASETNNDYFSVEKMMEPSQWESIGTIRGSTNSNSLQSYQMRDYKPQSGTNYYRIKQVDLDGKSSYSQMVSVVFEFPEIIELYPNPTSSVLTVKSQSAIQEIRLYNQASQMMMEKSSIQDSVYELDTQDLPNGVYILQVKTSRGFYYRKVIVQHGL